MTPGASSRLTRSGRGVVARPRPPSRRPASAGLLLAPLLAACGSGGEGPDFVRGELITFTGAPTSPNGAWCWFQDERAVVDVGHPDGPMLMFTAISASRTDSSEMGDLDLHFLGLEGGPRGTVELHDRLEQDDHDVAALVRLETGETLAMYSRHGSDPLVHVTRSGVHDPSTWSEPEVYTEEAGVTYHNLLTAGTGAERRLYDFSRSRGWNPNFLTYDPSSGTWAYGGRLLASEGRPYLKYRSSDDGSRIHVVATDQHPRDFDNSIYHGIMDGTRLTDSHGNVVDGDLSDQDAAAPSELTVVFRGDPDNVAWMADVETDPRGRPVIAFSVQKDGRGLPPGQGGLDHRYHLARFVDGGWVQHEIAHAGERLYPREDDYTGLVAIDPHDVDRLVISTNADPVTGAPLVSRADGLRHYELFEGTSTDGGATFTWTPLTRNSSVDNLRPIIPTWEGDRRVVLWMRGTYTSYTAWDTQIVGLVQDRR
ncbi:MAG TPA: BNR-4 repeat-containing protein [Longimicrobiales bacterium]|nr:BNR-4 repeat-containing protein [Longimicrobiales bacterium]